MIPPNLRVGFTLNPCSGGCVLEEYQISTDTLKRTNCLTADDLRAAIQEWAQRHTNGLVKAVFGQ